MENLTDKQQIVLAALQDIIHKQQQIPTLLTLKNYLALSFPVNSLNSIVQHLDSLERKGYIYRQKNKKGGISLRETETEVAGFGFWELPLLGLANCGSPSFLAEENFEGQVKVSKKLLPLKNSKGVFMVKVNGESMNKRGLKEGDYAIIRHKDFCGEIKNGDIVLAIVNGLATIKTFFRTLDAIILKPESTKKKFQPIFLHPEDNFFINGKLVGVFKNG